MSAIRALNTQQLPQQPSHQFTEQPQALSSVAFRAVIQPLTSAYVNRKPKSRQSLSPVSESDSTKADFERWSGFAVESMLKALHPAALRARLHQPATSHRAQTQITTGKCQDFPEAGLRLITAPQHSAKPTPEQILYGIYPGPFGEMLIANTEDGVCFLAFVDSGVGKQDAMADLKKLAGIRLCRQQAHPWQEHALEHLAWALSGQPNAKAKKQQLLPLMVEGTKFQHAVWQALAGIPAGEVRSYGQLAEHIGRPQAVRAVGTAVGANPVSLFLPCHRIVPGTGILGNYRWLPERKLALLGWELAYQARRQG